MPQPPSDSSQAIVVGRISGTHGLSGAVRAKTLSDVASRFDVGQTLFIQGGPYLVESSSRTSSNRVLLKFREIGSFSEAQGLVGEEVTVPEQSVPPLPEGEYFHFQLLGLRVLTEEGEDLGWVSEILETGSNDVYIVSNDSGELLLPALADVVRKIQVSEGLMVVRLPEGLR